MGTNKNSKNIYISHGITCKERIRENVKKKWKIKKKQERMNIPLTTKPKRVNKNEKLVRKFEQIN